MVKRWKVESYFRIHGFENRGGAGHDRLERADGKWVSLKRAREIEDGLFAELKRQAGLK